MMQSSVFMVNDEPYCLWGGDLHKRNSDFLLGLDPDYFEYSLSAHTSTEDEQRASVALRIDLHHALETLFSLIGAYVQAPDCAYAWIAKCSNADLRSFLARLLAGGPDIFTKLKVSSVDLLTISQSVFHTYLPGTNRQSTTIKLFASLWAKLARELTDASHVDEYNSLKHGFRVKKGGFALRVGVESTYGVPPPETDMHLLGRSDFGATFFRIESIGHARASRSLRSRLTSVNWSLERTVLLCQLCHVSINNVVSALRVVNGLAANRCKFLRPEKDEDFEAPWRYSTGVTGINFDDVVDENNTQIYTRQELLALIQQQSER